MRYRMLLVIALVAVGGCAKPLEVGSITEIKTTNGSKGIDVHEHKRVAGQPGVPEFAGDQLVEVRTFVSKDGSGDVEVPGGTCTVSAADFAATTQSPAKVRVPLYRGQSSTLAVACQLPGYKKQMITVSPIDVTRQARYSSGASSGVLGLVAVSAVDAFSDNTKNEWRYPVARLVLEPEPVGKIAAAR
jgi:hypothetical protein